MVVVKVSTFIFGDYWRIKMSDVETKMREFDSGATRSDDKDKLDFEGFLSPQVLFRYAQYLHKHRVQADGKLRDSDNWQKGMPISTYMKSKFRHFMDTWQSYRKIHDDNLSDTAIILSSDEIEISLCAELFNTMGFLHEILKLKSKTINSEIPAFSGREVIEVSSKVEA